MLDDLESAGGPDGPRGPEPPARRVGLWGCLLVLVVACLPSWGTLAAPVISDDALILGHVHRENAFRDWVGPQFGLHTLGFWRPVVSATWEIQERLSGTQPLPLRLYNLSCHALAALLAAGLFARLATRESRGWRTGALVAGLAVGLFPEQGGTLTWLAGRTDGTTSPLMLAALFVAAGAPWRRSTVLAGVLAFLACAAKEMAFVLPAWAFLLFWARGGVWGRRRVPAVVAIFLGTSLAFLWRRAALGSWIGGYPAPPIDLPGLGTALLTWAQSSSWSLYGVLLLGGAGAALGTLNRRLFFAGIGAALLGALPLVGLLVDGVLEATNVRVLRVGDLALALALGATVERLPRPRAAGARRWILAALFLLLGWRGLQAFADTHEWAAAGRHAEQRIALAREAVGTGPASQHPWLRADFPPVHGGAYCLAFGTADRFRAPFENSRLPVWPLRPVFALPASEREALYPMEDGWLRPFRDAPLLPRLEIVSTNGEPLESLAVDERAAREPDESPVFVVRGIPAGARLEFMLYTELGYQPAPVPAELLVDGALTLSLRQVFLSTGFVSLGDCLIQTADFGATRAYLEVRAIDPHGEVLSASEWIELEWSADLLERIFP